MINKAVLTDLNVLQDFDYQNDGRDTLNWLFDEINKNLHNKEFASNLAIIHAVLSMRYKAFKENLFLNINNSLY